MSFINFNNRTAPEAGTYSARMIAEALYQVETKNINKIKSLVESIKEPLATAEALKMFENKLVALNALQTAAANAMPVNEGQFSWMTQDTGEQIGSERENRITVYMYDNEGNQYKEAKYDGYGEFGGMDYYELLARMNGYTEEDLEEVKGPFKEMRQLGIDVAFDKLPTKDKGKKVLYPALVTDPRYNWKKHDFTQEAESDPDQSWYVEPEYDEEYYEAQKIEEAKVTAMPVNEGQFSWMTQDTGEQIGSERENRITVYMYDNEGNSWEEKQYKGYGNFGGMDYYELLDKMNGGEGDRGTGIELAFDKKKVKAGKVLFPALVTDPRYNWERHNFKVEAKHDPNQSWLQEKKYDEEYLEEAKSIAKIQKEWAKVTAMMKDTVDKWKAAEGQEKEDLLTQLKTLTISKKKLEVELDDAVGLKDADAELVGEAKNEIKYYKTISKKDWEKAPKDYKSTIDGEHYMMFLDDKLGSILAPVKVEEAYTEDDINTGYGFYGTINMKEDDKTTQQLFDRSVKDFMKEFKISEEAALAVLNSKMGRKAADQIIDGQSKTAVDALKDYYGKTLKKEMDKVIAANEGLNWDSLIEKVKNTAVNEWGSSDQSIMNKAIHKDAGSPKKMPSPFDSKLRAAAESAVDFYWDDWKEYETDRDGLIDNAVRGYLRSYFKKDWDLMVRMFEPMESVVTEAKNSKEIKELEELLKSIKSNTPAAQGRKAAIQDDIERLKNESVVTEAKFVKDFNRDVLNAKTKEEVLELYPNAEFFIGKSDHFFGELDSNLFFKAYYTKAQKEFEIKTVYSEKGRNYVNLYNESVVSEAGMNDPVLMAFRAAKMKREKELAKPKRKPLYGKQREKAEDDLWQISQDLKDLYADRGQMLIDMEQEAEAEGGPIADEYGDKLNKIEDEIQKLIAKRSKLEMRLAESVVTEAKNTIGLAFKEEQDYLDFVEFIKDERGSIKKDFGWDSKTKSWEVIMDVKVLDRIYGEGTPSNKESGWYGGLPGDFESVIIESVVNEAVARNTKIYQIATPAPKAMLVEELEDLFGDDYRHIVTEFEDDEGFESVLVFNLTPRDIKRIQEEIGDVLIWEYSIKKGKEIMESVVNEEDYSDEMSYGQLESCIDNANMIRDRIDSGVSLDAWMHSQIAVAKNELTSVFDALDGDDGVVEKFELTEGVMSDIHQLANKVKDEEEFVKQFFKEYGAKVKKSPESVEWVKSLYTDTVEEAVVNEAKKLDRDAMIDWLDQTLSFTRTSEEFDGAKGGIWTTGENGEEWKGKVIYAYYSEDYKNRTFGVLNSWEKELNKRGWYSEWYDAGTVMIWPN